MAEFDSVHFSCLSYVEDMLDVAREVGDPVNVRRLQEILQQVWSKKWFMSFLNPLFMDGKVVGVDVMGYVSRDAFLAECEAGNIQYSSAYGGWAQTVPSAVSFSGRFLSSDLEAELEQQAGALPRPTPLEFREITSQIRSQFRDKLMGGLPF